MNNDNYNAITATNKAASGFKTFIITLSISLVIASTGYYLFGNSPNTDIEKFGSQTIIASEEITTKTDKSRESGVKGTRTNTVTESPFGELAKRSPSILAEADEVDETDSQDPQPQDEEADESTESTVPETGSATLVWTLISTTLFSLALYTILIVKPRKLALAKFENSITKN